MNGNLFNLFAELATWIAEHLRVESAVLDGEIACLDGSRAAARTRWQWRPLDVSPPGIDRSRQSRRCEQEFQQTQRGRRNFEEHGRPRHLRDHLIHFWNGRRYHRNCRPYAADDAIVASRPPGIQSADVFMANSCSCGNRRLV